ncbi:MAG: selenocysteine-specific translation factor [Candidatus Poribacteria bacterium]|nr:MAG: selenocysteine-specific translation factor [Candidatus Poribacteria bacterium]
MRHLIIGTAGHVDHGKTTLIRALTGIETDRLEEEKRRGLSIELGFAYFELPDGHRVGIVDVPGHERFLDTMLAGAYGMDLILLVVSAREGVQPQTVEHLQILDLLGVSEGILVVTMADLVDDETVQIVLEEARELLEGTSLEGIPSVVVDSVSGRGLEALRAELVAAAQRLLSASPDEGVPRLPIDRVFVLSGFGVVVTGTLRGGSLEVEQQVRILPSGRTARIRSIQVHHQGQSRAEARQRVALNLVGVEKAEISRGDLIVPLPLDRLTDRVDVALRVLEDYPRIVEDHQRVRMFLGTWNGFARLILLEPEHREGLLPGAEAIAQLRLEEPRPVFRGERFVLRDDSIRRTLGGGEVLDPFARRHRRFRAELVSELGALRSGVPEAETLRALLRRPWSRFLPGGLLPYYFPDRRDYAGLSEKAGALQLGGWLLLSEELDRLRRVVVEALEAMHHREPLTLGPAPEELRHRAAPEVPAALFSAFLDRLREEGALVLDRGAVRLPGHQVRFEGEDAALRDAIVQRLRASGMASPSPRELEEELGAPLDRILAVLNALRLLGEVVHVGEDYWLHVTAERALLQTLREHFLERETLEIAELRERTGLSRKYAVPLLEYCDRQGWTVRVGNARRARPGLWGKEGS